VIGFVLALMPLLVILIGIALFKQSGARMACVGWLVAVVLAITYFHTPVGVAVVASLEGLVKSFGISIAVAFTMYLIFLMGAVGALSVISERVKRLVVGAENQALYIGVGFGSFLTSLGVVTPALFPPLLVVMGFSPFAAVAVAVLGYNATTSFALLSIPITLPAEVFKFDPVVLAYKISLFLPVISVGLAFAILWLIGGRESMRRGWRPAIIVGLAIALSCLLFTGIDYHTGTQYIPLRVVGVLAGLVAMGALQLYQRLTGVRSAPAPAVAEGAPPRMSFARAVSPWAILTVLAIVVSVPAMSKWLSDLPGRFEVIPFYSNEKADLNLFSAIYTWILIAILLALPLLRPSREEVAKTTRLWLKRVGPPFLAYAVSFSIAYVYLASGKQVVGGELVQSAFYQTYNMNIVLGTTLAAIFGAGYVFVAASLGLFGAVVGGSEASSNVMFYQIQKEACTGIHLNDAQFMTVYSSHAVAGGVASAITPAKLNNAVATIDAGTEVESQVMRKHLVVAIILTIATGILTGLFVNLVL
jgi:lactate permease